MGIKDLFKRKTVITETSKTILEESEKTESEKKRPFEKVTPTR